MVDGKCWTGADVWTEDEFTARRRFRGGSAFRGLGANS